MNAYAIINGLIWIVAVLAAIMSFVSYFACFTLIKKNSHQAIAMFWLATTHLFISIINFVVGIKCQT